VIEVVQFGNHDFNGVFPVTFQTREFADPESFAVPASVEFSIPMKLDMENVRRAIKTLKPEYQDVIILRFVEDASLKETAGALEKTEGAVKLLQHRAIKELKKVLKLSNDET